MRIVYCIPSLHNSGGMERVLTQKANYLADKAGYEVIIITSNQKDRNNFYRLSPNVKRFDLDIDYEKIKESPLYRRIPARIKAKSTHKEKLSRLLFELKPDICISMFTHEMTFLPKIKDGSKKILELHFSKNFRKLDALSNGAPLYLRIINNILDYIDRKSIKKYDKFVVLSHQDAKDWGKKYKNLAVIPNPVAFLPPPPHNYAINIQQKKVLAVGRLCRQKGFDLLIKIWSQLPEELQKEWHLDIIGKGPEHESMNILISELGLENSVTLKGHTENIEKEYESHDIFCFTSRYEGFGLALAEAMAYSMACISFDCQCGPSDLIEDNYNGFLVKSFDTKKFLFELISLMKGSDLREKLGINAYKFISDNLSESNILTTWINLFKQMISNKTTQITPNAF